MIIADWEPLLKGNGEWAMIDGFLTRGYESRLNSSGRLGAHGKEPGAGGSAGGTVKKTQIRSRVITAEVALARE